MGQDMNMPQRDIRGRSTAGRAVGTGIKGARVVARGGTHAGRWAIRNVLFMRTKGAGGEIGMMRLLDLHAASCAGDTLVTMGLATTVFFQSPVGEARGRVAVYLFITMVPFALLAPVVGPVLDRFRHGRRYALAVTMLGRAFLAWMISDYLHSFGLFPAAFGVLALSRAYGVARSAAVPRLLPAGLGLSEAGARASIFGTLAGAVVAPLGVLALKIGPQWPLRVAAVIFVLGAVVALRLPPRADSDPPEVPPRIFQWAGRRPTAILSGPLLVSALTNAALLRAAYGFLVLFLAFSIRSHDLTTQLFGTRVSGGWALAVAIGALGAGSFIAPAVGARLRIRRPLLLQTLGLVLVAGTGILATIWYSLGAVILLSLAVSIVGGLAKLAVDATIQERVSEETRASAFAHSETLLMLAFVLGGAIGLIPFNGRLGIIVCTVGMVAAAVHAWLRATAMRGEKLSGSAMPAAGPGGAGVAADASTVAASAGSHPPYGSRTARTVEVPGGTTYRQGGYVHGTPAEPEPTSWWSRHRAARATGTPRSPRSPRPKRNPAPTLPEPGPSPATTTTTVPQPGNWPGGAGGGPSESGVETPGARGGRTRMLPRTDDEPPGFHLYRPSSAQGETTADDEGSPTS
jgi:MFS family permease